MGARNIDPLDLVLGIVAFNKDEKVEGRTFLQKLAYFLNEKLKLGVEFEPHYYGPYSKTIAMATSTLVELEFLNEKEDKFPAAPTSIFEPRKYTYQLTLAGQTILSELQQQEPSLLDSIKKTMGEITAKEECNYECLSLAAKMFHILKSRGRQPLRVSELSTAAKELGWKLSTEEVDKAAKFLKELGLIKEVA